MSKREHRTKKKFNMTKEQAEDMFVRFFFKYAIRMYIEFI